MFKLVPFSPELDLTTFYEECTRRGFTNNNSQKVMVDCLDKETRKQMYILYKGDVACGAVGSHTLPELGENAYRICVRACAFPEYRPNQNVVSAGIFFKQHQSVVSQYFIPQCIEFAGRESDMYISSHPSNVGTQRIVHNFYGPLMEKAGYLTRHCELEYRGHLQTFWKLNTERFLEDLSKTYRWTHPEEPSLG